MSGSEETPRIIVAKKLAIIQGGLSLRLVQMYKLVAMIQEESLRLCRIDSQANI
jgi:hypothetical protein